VYEVCILSHYLIFDVANVRFGVKLRSPEAQPGGLLCPEEQTCSEIIGMSQTCQKLTFTPRLRSHLPAPVVKFWGSLKDPVLCEVHDFTGLAARFKATNEKG
jgi:hypothetical protein